MKITHTRVLIGVGVAILLLTVLVVVLATTRGTLRTDPGSPEGVVHRYLTAALAGESRAAAAYLDPSSGCTAADLDRSYSQPGSRVELLDTTVTGDTARVEVDITAPSAGLVPDFGDQTQVYRLVRSSTGWLLTGIPWPLFGCGVGFR